MRDWMSLILQWGSPITQVVLLCMQIYTYRRTRHYSLVLIVVASVLGLLASTLIRILNSEVLVPLLHSIDRRRHWCCSWRGRQRPTGRKYASRRS